MTPAPRLEALKHRAERLVLSSVLSLPDAVQRRLAGRPVVLDGVPLSTDTQLMLRLQRLAREPGAETLPIGQGRKVIRQHALATGGQQPIGQVRDLVVDGMGARLYVPAGAPEVGPLLVFFHGGGWIYGDLETYEPACRFLAEGSGVRVLSVDYRLAPEHPFPAAHDDAIAAYRWVVDHAAELGADPARLAVGGDSAGGCLAATTAIVAAREGLPLAFQLLIYPGTDMAARTGSRELFADGFYLTRGFIDLARTTYLPEGTPLDDPRASPHYADLPAGLAPAHVVTAGFDPLRDEGETYARLLEEAGVGVELTRYADQIHGFFCIVGVGTTSRRANAEIAGRLRAALA